MYNLCCTVRLVRYVRALKDVYKDVTSHKLPCTRYKVPAPLIRIGMGILEP